MSTNMKKAKKGTGATFPERQIDGTGLYAELEPLIDGETMARSYLFGIPLISPLTKERLGPKDLESFIKRGLGRFQLEAKTSVQTRLVRHRMPFDPQLYAQFVALEIPFKPIRRVKRLAICSAAYGSINDFGEEESVSLENDHEGLFPDGQSPRHTNPWHLGTPYGLGAIVTWNGSSYASAVSANVGNQPDTSPAQWTLAAWDGAWSNVTTYGIGAVVKYNNNLYVSQQVGNLGNVPIMTPAFWATATSKPKHDHRFPSGSEIYRIPNEWIEMGNATRGLLNVVPLGVVFSGGGLGFEAQAGSLTGSALLQVIGALGFLPAFWTVECETGLMDPEGMVPVIVNEAIGSAAAIYALEVMLPLFRIASQSMSVDGLSQSVTDRIIELIELRLDKLEKRYAMIIKHLKVMFGNSFFTSNV